MPASRNSFAVILFWSDDFSVTANIDTSSPSAGIWNVPVVNNKTYNFMAGYVYTWIDTFNYNFPQYAIVWYNGIFFIKYSSGTINPTAQNTNPLLAASDFCPLVVGQAFTIGGVTYASLTELDIYDLVYNSLYTRGLDIGIATGVQNIACDPFHLDKISCHSFLMTNNSGFVIDSISLLDWNGTLVKELVMSGTSCNIDLDEDGLYQLYIEYNNGDTTTLTILDLCDAEACYLKNFKKILCMCKGCDNQKEVEEINTIMHLILSIRNISELPDYETTDIGLFLEKLNLIINRCGVC